MPNTSRLDDPLYAQVAWSRYWRLMRWMAMLTLACVAVALGILYYLHGLVSIHMYIAAAAGVSDYSICPEGVIAAELKTGRANGATLIVKGQPAYPSVLDDVDDAPPILWAIGDLELLQRR